MYNGAEMPSPDRRRPETSAARGPACARAGQRAEDARRARLDRRLRRLGAPLRTDGEGAAMGGRRNRPEPVSRPRAGDACATWRNASSASASPTSGSIAPPSTRRSTTSSYRTSSSTASGRRSIPAARSCSTARPATARPRFPSGSARSSRTRSTSRTASRSKGRSSRSSTRASTSGSSATPTGQTRGTLRREDFDLRWVPCRRPFIVTGGELTLEMLDLSFNHAGQVLRGAAARQSARRHLYHRRFRPPARQP